MFFYGINNNEALQLIMQPACEWLLKGFKQSQQPFFPTKLENPLKHKSRK
jgi:hypothetical protein